MDTKLLKEAAQIIKNAKHLTAFTGAGISVESGIPPFRGPQGLWNTIDPTFIEISYFQGHYADSWKDIKKIFYDFFGQAKPNAAHLALAELEKMGILKAIITQNIDNLHQDAGSKVVYEFHGTASTLLCLRCNERFSAQTFSFEEMPPKCPKCGGKIKPDFVFYGEGIPEKPYRMSMKEATEADVFLVIGTTGEVMPACIIPQIARQNGAKVIEINISHSALTHGTTTHFLQGKAAEIMSELMKEIKA
jgi:NAD-dependent deacetylase